MVFSNRNVVQSLHLVYSIPLDWWDCRRGLFPDTPWCKSHPVLRFDQNPISRKPIQLGQQQWWKIQMTVASFAGLPDAGARKQAAEIPPRVCASGRPVGTFLIRFTFNGVEIFTKSSSQTGATSVVVVRTRNRVRRTHGKN